MPDHTHTHTHARTHARTCTCWQRRVRRAQGVVQHITMNDLPIGRSVDEALRVLQAIQFVAK